VDLDEVVLSISLAATTIPESSTETPCLSTYDHSSSARRPDRFTPFPHSHRLYYYYDDMHIIPRFRNVFGETWIQGYLESI